MVDRYGQYCPVALAAEVFAERWTPIIVRNMMVGCRHFGEILDGAPGLSRSLLSKRLRTLQHARIVTRTCQEGRAPVYDLTEAGRELGEVCLMLGAWGARWREARTTDLDPYLALWMLARLIDPEGLPSARVVVRFDLTDGSRPGRYWLVATEEGSEVCAEFPGFEEDAVVTTDRGWLVRWHTGEISLPAATRAGGITVQGPRRMYRLLSTWGELSPYATIARDRAEVRSASGPR